ncbi:MAG: Zn-dependent hydrolase [Chloroflexi bacterium]|nr:MAG: Zn-dependent hydrolase [Chloroflexota bacterium]
MTDVNRDRLLDDLRALSTIGAQPDGGVDRLAWSDADLAGRRWYAERIREAGLEPRVDAALNVFGHIAGSAGPWLLTGSHLDSVPDGGRLDGAYGAVAALEVLRTLAESGDSMAERVEIVGFSDEEGVRFKVGLIGSLALVGELDVGRLRGGQDWKGVPVPQVLATAGRDIDRLNEATQHLHSVKAFIELHIEQGQLQDLVLAADPEAVANIGMMRFDPGGVNVIPGRAEFTLEVRHLEERVVRQAVDAFARRLEAVCAEEGCRAEVELLSWVPPAPMDPSLTETLAQACRELGRPPGKLWSGAGHDAAVLSRHVPAGMLFVPSAGGISHSPRETTSDEHLVLGTQALLRAVRHAAASIK